MLAWMIRCRTLLVGAALLAALPMAAASQPAHGFAVLGTLKYPAGFEHFDYADPAAPKGGHLHLSYFGSFDNVNPFILKGNAAAGSNLFGVDGRALTFETLMEASKDEPDSYYGLIAQGVELPDDRQSITFTLRPEARWHDGSAITAADVVFSFDTLKAEGHPSFRIQFRDVERGIALEPHKVRFEFAAGAETRDLPALVAEMPVISKAYYADRKFADTTLEPPLGSGAYAVERVNEGRSITYRRVEDHWGRNLAVYRGRWNFDRITYDYYRDRDIALEALFAGKIDFREDFTSRNWATKYDNVPAVVDGRLKRAALPDGQPSGFQAFYINTRRDKFRDRRVRQAIGLVFDFEWTNKNLFYGQYARTKSFFSNSELASSGLPSADELKILEPLRGQVPDAVFTKAYEPPKTDGSGNIRANLRQGLALLKEAGWTFKNRKLVNGKTGKPFAFEILLAQPTWERIALPFARNLERLGIEARVRTVDSAQYQKRLEEFDFDMVVGVWGESLSPGNEQREFWGSEAADRQGSRNIIGIKDKAVDTLIDLVIAAPDRKGLITRTRALDRVLLWGHYVIPHWHIRSFRVAYWDKFDRPKVTPRYALGFDTWWVDPAKAAALDARKKKN